MITHQFDYLGRSWRLFKPPGHDAEHHPWRIRFSDTAHGLRPTVIILVPHLHPRDQIPGAIARARAHIDQRRRAGDAYTQWLASQRQRSTLTLGPILDAYLAAGAPTRRTHGTPRSEHDLTAINSHARVFRRYWDSRCPNSIRITGTAETETSALHYLAWRRANSSKGTGERSADLDLTYLSQACDWAIAAGRLQSNPFTGRPRLRAAAAVVHANHAQPTDADELHTYARWMIEAGDHVCAARLLFAALTGLRSHEQVQLRRDARFIGYTVNQQQRRVPSAEPGHIQALPDGRRVIHCHRGKGGINQYIPIHPDLDQLLILWFRWLDVHAPGNPWFFPAALTPTASAQHPRRVTDALRDLWRTKQLPRRTGHALRSFFATVQLDSGASPGEAAALLGQRTGGSLIGAHTGAAYGAAPDLVAEPITFRPKHGTPAWELFRLPENIVPLAQTA